jgi:hypothetical protein
MNYRYFLLPFWLIREIWREFYKAILQPDPPDWREKRDIRNAKIDALWQEVQRDQRQK